MKITPLDKMKDLMGADFDLDNDYNNLIANSKPVNIEASLIDNKAENKAIKSTFIEDLDEEFNAEL